MVGSSGNVEGKYPPGRGGYPIAATVQRSEKNSLISGDLINLCEL